MSNVAYLDLFGAIWRHLEPFRTIWIYFKLNEAIKSLIEQLGANLSHMEPFRSIRSYFELLRAIIAILRNLELGLFRAIWSDFEQF